MIDPGSTDDDLKVARERTKCHVNEPQSGSLGKEPLKIDKVGLYNRQAYKL